MTLTLLFDLDDTLLDSNMDNFIPVYFQTLGKEMTPFVDPEQMLKQLMVGTDVMLQHDDPTETLGQAFDRNFYPYLGVDRSILDPEIVRFYAEVFPTLSYLTKPHPEAVELIQWAVEQGYRIAIATNPLFPQAAVLHRLRWAGLEPDDYPFEVIPSFERFHFSKPNPAYLAEVMGQMGFPDGPILMIGDDPVRDVVAAEELGVAMYWIADKDARLPDERKPLAGQGRIGDLRAWLDTVEPETLLPNHQSRTAIVAMAKAIPAILRSLLTDIPSDLWSYRASPDEWCLNEILGHLRDVEREVNLPRIKTFLNEGNPFIKADDTDVWAAERGYALEDGYKTLQDFVVARVETLAAIRALSDEDWQRTGRHAIFGPITLQEQLAFMTEHDRVHIRQVYDVLKQAVR